MICDIKNWHWILALFDTSSLHQSSKFNNFLWVCSCLGIFFPILYPPAWKLDNPYYHTIHCQFFFVKAQRTVLKLSQLTIFFQVFKITNDAIAPLERDFLLKLGCVENLAVSKLTMQSLSHLLTQISNIGEMINLVKLIFFSFFL